MNVSPLTSTSTRKWAVFNDFFDNIYVLTIPRNEHRRKHLDEQLAGLNFEYFYGVDGKSINAQTKKLHAYDQRIMEERDREIARKYLKIYRQGPVVINEIACAISHKLIYEDIVKKGYDNVLILEDDVQIAAQNLPELDTILSQLPSDWELLYLGYQLNIDFNFAGHVKKHLISALHGMGLRMPAIADKYASYPRPYKSHLQRAGVHTNAEAYAIRQSTARKLVEWQSPIGWIADHILMDACAQRTLNAFISKPKLFAQAGPSSIWTK